MSIERFRVQSSKCKLGVSLVVTVVLMVGGVRAAKAESWAKAEATTNVGEGEGETYSRVEATVNGETVVKESHEPGEISVELKKEGEEMVGEEMGEMHEEMGEVMGEMEEMMGEGEVAEEEIVELVEREGGEEVEVKTVWPEWMRDWWATWREQWDKFWGNLGKVFGGE